MLSDRKRLMWLRWVNEGAKIFSTCGKRQYMAVILDNKGHVVGMGYNGSPSGMKHCVDGGCPRLINNTDSGSTYDDCISCHAEDNAISHSNWSDLRHGATMVVNGTPCWDCTKKIANSGITAVVAIEDHAYPNLGRSVELLRSLGIRLVLYGKDHVERGSTPSSPTQ